MPNYGSNVILVEKRPNDYNSSLIKKYILAVPMKILGTVTLVSFIFFLNADLAHAKVYKWVDENGKVHYSDKPFDEDSKQLNIKDKLTPEQQRAAKEKARQFVNMQRKRVNSQFEADYETKKEKSTREKAARKLSQDCKLARSEHKKLKMPVRIYTPGKNGEREYMSDEARQNEIKRLETFISQACSDE